MSQPYILIIEDDPDIQRLLAHRVRGVGAEVGVASSGEEGLTLAATHAPALILLDLNLPGINGWAVLERLRQQDATADTPVLVVSIEDEVQSAAPAVQGWLAKPFHARDLDAAVREILALQPEAVA